MNIDSLKLTKQELSLLLFLETQVVDFRGAVNTCCMNDNDMKTLALWKKGGFVESGRICADSLRDSSLHLVKLPTENRSIWVRLSPTAWSLAHKERIARSERMWNVRRWKTTEEARS